MIISVQFSLSVVSDSMWPHGLQHTRLPGPPLSPRIAQTHVHCVDDAIQSSRPLSPPSPPALNFSQHQGLFSELALHIRGQSIGASTLASVFLMNIQGWFPLELTGFISLLSKKLSKVFCSTTIRKPQFFSTQPSLGSNCHISMTTGKPWLQLCGTLLAKWCLCFLICCLGLS